MTTTTIRDGVILLLVLVKKSAAKTHIYYSIHISLLLFSSHEVLETNNNVREREKRFRSVFCLLLLLSLFFSTFFSCICMENNEIFFRSRENEKKCINNAKRGRERKFPPFFLTHFDEYIIIIAQTRAYTKNHLSNKEECIIVA